MTLWTDEFVGEYGDGVASSGSPKVRVLRKVQGAGTVRYLLFVAHGLIGGALLSVVACVVLVQPQPAWLHTVQQGGI